MKTLLLEIIKEIGVTRGLLFSFLVAILVTNISYGIIMSMYYSVFQNFI
jgi:hypothetical protein